MAVRVVSAKDVTPEPFPGRDVRALVGVDTPVPASQLSLVITTFRPGGVQLPVHEHTAFEEVIYVAQGSGEIWVDGQVASVQAGDVFLLPASAKHAVRNSGEVDLVLVCSFSAPDFRDGRVNHEDLAPYATEEDSEDVG